MCRYAYEHHVPVAYVQCKARKEAGWKNPDGSEKLGGIYGPVNAFVEVGVVTSFRR